MTSSPHKLPLLVGHRGAAAHAPENTLASFKLAIDQGADFVEGDFWLSADRRLVCLHDATTARIAPRQEVLDVRSAVLADLKKLDAGQWKGEAFKGQTIPTLDEVLALLPRDRGIYIEIKHDHPALMPVLEKTLAESGTGPDQVKIIAFEERVIVRTKQVLPGLEAYWLCEYAPGENTDLAARKDTLLRTAKAIRADGLDMGRARDMTAEFAERIRRQGLGLHFWTVNSPDEAEHFISLGAQSLTTDRPLGLRRDLLGRTAAGTL